MPLGSTIRVTFLIILVLFSMFYFVNSLYYSLSLLCFIILVLIFLVSNRIMSSLTMIMLSIVYIGAIIILIGYICAICPNVIVVSSFSSPSYAFFLSLFFYLFSFGLNYPLPSHSDVSMVEYFYSSSGLFIFSIIITMLFVTLLIVTSQYLTPKGPFRSVS